MKIRVMLFAYLRETVGYKEKELEIQEGTRVGELWNNYKAKFAIEGNLRILFAVNEEYVDGERELRDGDEVAFIPPVSGG